MTSCQQSRPPLRMMIVDDNGRVRAMLRRMLSRMTEDLHEAENGREAVDRYSMLRPDCVLMDIRMPVLDGIEATRRITGMDPNAQVLIVTDYDDAGFRDAARQAGAHGYFLKDNLLHLPGIIMKLTVENQQTQSIHPQIY